MREHLKLPTILASTWLLAAGCVTIERDTATLDAGLDAPTVEVGGTDTTVMADAPAPLDTPGADLGTPEVGPPDVVALPDAEPCPLVGCGAVAFGGCVGQQFDPTTCGCVPVDLEDGTGCACGGTCQGGACMLEAGPAGCTSDGDCEETPGLCKVTSCNPQTCACETHNDVACCETEQLCDQVPCHDGVCTEDGCDFTPTGECLGDADCGAPSDSCHTVACTDCACVETLIAPGCTTCTVNGDCGGCGACSLAGVCYDAPFEDKFCLTAISCDDGNPCTVDSCTGDSGCKGCVHKPLPGCELCTVDADCDDGDPCTANTCVGEPDRICHYPLAETAECKRCVFDGHQTLNDVKGFSAGTTAKTGGTAQEFLQPDKDCVGCSEVGCCDACTSRLRFVSELGGPEFVVVDRQDEPWACSLSASCPTQPVVCTPMHPGVDYWAWGTMAAPPAGAPTPPDGSTPPPYLAVDGWCQMMTKEGLGGAYSGQPGHFKGQIWSAADHNNRLEVEIVIGYSAGTISGTIVGTSLPPDSFLTFGSDAMQDLQVLAGVLSFNVQLTLKWWFVEVPITAAFKLQGRGNQLHGTWLGTGTLATKGYLLPGYAELSRQPLP